MVMMFLRWSSRKKKIIMDCDFGFHLIYGARTTYVLAIKGFPGTHKFLFLDEGKWQHVKETTNISEGKMFSPGNLRATFDNPDYDKIIVKEKGVFTNFISPATKAMLRLLFEVVPLGLLVENVGGYSSDAHQSARQAHCKVAYGSKNEIIRFEETLYGSSRLKGGVAVGAAAQVFSFAFMPFLFLVSLRKNNNQNNCITIQ